MTPRLRKAILRAQRETRLAEGRQTTEDVATEQRFRESDALKHFCGFYLAIPTAHELEPAVEWGGTAAIARFTVDGKAFIIRKEAAEFVLLAGRESGQELARIEAKSEFRGAAKLLNALGNFLGVSGTEAPEP